MKARSCFFDHVLCAIEPVRQSAAALYNSVAFAEPDGRLQVLTVAPPARGHASAEALADALADKRDALHNFVWETVPSDVPYLPTVDLEVAFGDPAREILLAAERLATGLVVMSTRGHGRLLEAVVGSVAHNVLRHARAAVMVIPPFETELVSLEATRPVFHFGRILVPLDLLRVNAHQLRVAARLTRASHEPLLLLHVQRPGQPPPDESELSNLIKEHDLAATTAIASVQAPTVAQGIVEAARRRDAGLIVMGLERGAKRMEPGAISYEVIRRSNAVVLAVPPDGSAGG